MSSLSRRIKRDKNLPDSSSLRFCIQHNAARIFLAGRLLAAPVIADVTDSEKTVESVDEANSSGSENLSDAAV